MEILNGEKNRFAFKNRLNSLLDERGIPPLQKGRIVQLADILATSQVTVRKWLDTENPVLPKTGMLIRIAETFSASIDDLLGRTSSNHDQLDCESCEVSKHAILTTQAIKREEFAIIRTSFISKEESWYKDGNYYTMFEVNSDCMYPTLRVGDIAILENANRIEENKIYCMLLGGGITFRRVMINKSGKYEIIADNQHYPILEYDQEEIDINMSFPGEKLPENKKRLRILGRVCAATKIFL